MVGWIAEQFVGELAVVGQLTVEGKREPLRAVEVMIFERLSVTAVVFAACCITHVTDRGGPGVLFLQRFGFGRV